VTKKGKRRKRKGLVLLKPGGKRVEKKKIESGADSNLTGNGLGRRKGVFPTFLASVRNLKNRRSRNRPRWVCTGGGHGGKKDKRKKGREKNNGLGYMVRDF